MLPSREKIVAKRKSTAMQVAVYDMANNPLSEKFQREITEAVELVIKGSGSKETLAYTVVNE